MNPTALLHHPPPFDVPFSSLGHDRSYSNLSPFSANDYHYRRAPNGLTHSGLGTTLANSNLDYNPQPPLTDGVGSCHQHSVLSPPESLSGGISSVFASTTLPKPFTGNATVPDVFTGASGLLSSSWGDSTMTTLDRSRLATIPPLTPPVSYAPSGGGISSTGLLLSRHNMDRTFPSFSQGSAIPGGYNTMRPLTNAYAYRNGPYTPYSHEQYPQGHSAAMPEVLPTKPEGPPFGKTTVLHSVFSGMRHEMKPDITASIPKGFFQVDGKWTCYRRNYFSVSCAFTLKPPSTDSSFFISLQDRYRQVNHFAVAISAKTASASNQESEPRGLVQHTPKRDKATERTPERQLISPAPAHSMHGLGHMGGIAGMLPPAMQPTGMTGYASFESPNQQPPPPAHTFERIQFQKATANNGKRRAQQQYFHVVVELSACVMVHGREEWQLLATRESEQMVVRGRSPGHYKDNNNRRDSQTSMDRDGHSGTGSDGSGAHYGYPTHHHHQSSMDWSSRNLGHQHHHYHDGGHNYRSAGVMAGSPPSTGSSTTLTESPTSTEFAMSEAGTLKSPRYSYEHSTSMTESDVSDEGLNIGGSPLSRKRPLEDDSDNEDSPHQCSASFSDNFMSNSMELSGFSQSNMLCASS